MGIDFSEWINIHWIDEIAWRIVEKKGLDLNEFKKLRKQVMYILTQNNMSITNNSRYIKSLPQFSTAFWQNVSKDFSIQNNILFNILKFSFKTEVAIILWRKKINKLWLLLSKIEGLEYWCPTTLDRIGRMKKRVNDPTNIFQDFFSENEKNELNAIYTWIKNNIRTENWENIDWLRLIKELEELWYKTLADKFLLKK